MNRNRSNAHPGARASSFARNLRTVVAVASLIPCFALGMSSGGSVHAANPYGEWKPALDVDVPGTPVAELTFAGQTYLLLEGIHPDSAVEAFLWNTSQSIALVAGPGDIFVSIDAVVGMQTPVGPRVFACGLMFIGGVETRLAMWDGAGWGLPGTGPVSGPAIRGLAVRNGAVGPELWIGGGLLSVPGLSSPRTIATFDGTAWNYPGPFSGLVETITAVEDSTSGITQVIVTGENLVTSGGIGGNLLRYDGTDWDDMNGGVFGSDLIVSPVRLATSEVEIWVTGALDSAGTATNLQSIARFRNGVWEAFSAPGGFLLGSPGRLLLLPTGFGSMVFSDQPIFSFPGSGNFVPGAWDPDTGAWIEVPTSSEGAFRFVSPSGLFPGDFFFRSTSPIRLRWEAGVGTFLRGDANGDGTINLGDAISALSFSFLGQDLACVAAADANADDTIDIADPVQLLALLFPNGAPPPVLDAPYPNCGSPAVFGNLPCDDSGCP